MPVTGILILVFLLVHSAVAGAFGPRIYMRNLWLGFLDYFRYTKLQEDGRKKMPCRQWIEHITGDVDFAAAVDLQIKRLADGILTVYRIAWAYLSPGQTVMFIPKNDRVVPYYSRGSSFTEFELDVPAQIQNGRLMVPLQIFRRIRGFHVDWNQQTRTVTVTKTATGRSIRYVIGDRKVYDDDGTFQEFEAAAMIAEGRSLVPLRAIGRFCNVEWQEYYKRAIVSCRE